MSPCPTPFQGIFPSGHGGPWHIQLDKKITADGLVASIAPRKKGTNSPWKKHFEASLLCIYIYIYILYLIVTRFDTTNWENSPTPPLWLHRFSVSTCFGRFLSGSTWGRVQGLWSDLWNMVQIPRVLFPQNLWHSSGTSEGPSWHLLAFWSFSRLVHLFPKIWVQGKHWNKSPSPMLGPFQRVCSIKPTGWLPWLPWWSPRHLNSSTGYSAGPPPNSPALGVRLWKAVGPSIDSTLL